MARIAERKLTWIPPTGLPVLLSDYFNGFQVLEGITGFDAPTFDHNEIVTPAIDGSAWLGTRAMARNLFVPVKVWGTDRTQMLAHKQTLLASLNPQTGQTVPGVFSTGILRVQDINGSSRSISAFYDGGVEGDEGKDLAGRDWTTYGLKFRTTDAFWSDSTPSSQLWTNSSGGKFFPFFPLKVGPSQILSGTGVTVHNNVLNPSAEYALTGWVAKHDPSIVQTDPVLTRQNSIKLIGNWGGRIDWNAGTAEQWVEVELDGRIAGVSHMLDIWMYTHGLDQIVMGTLSDIETWIPGVNGTNIGATGFQDGWSHWVIHTLPSSAHGRLVIAKRSGTAGGFLVLDQMQINPITEQDFPGDIYVDGDQLNCVWEGTPGYSVSHRVPDFAPTSIQVTGDSMPWPVWYFSGPFTDITVRNNTTGRDFRFTLNVPVGSTLTLDTRPRRQSASLRTTAGVVTNVWPNLVDNDLFPLILGNNDLTITVSGTDGNSSASLTWYSQYMAAA